MTQSGGNQQASRDNRKQSRSGQEAITDEKGRVDDETEADDSEEAEEESAHPPCEGADDRHDPGRAVATAATHLTIEAEPDVLRGRSEAL